MACCALSLDVAARRMSPGLPAGRPLLKLRCVLVVLVTLPEASDMASESCEADSLRSTARTTSAALGSCTAGGAGGRCAADPCRHKQRAETHAAQHSTAPGGQGACRMTQLAGRSSAGLKEGVQQALDSLLGVLLESAATFCSTARHAPAPHPAQTAVRPGMPHRHQRPG